MVNSHRFDGKTLNRSLLVGGIIFVGMWTFNMCVVPHYPVLDEQPFAAAVAAAVAAAAWWIVFRARGR